MNTQPTPTRPRVGAVIAGAQKAGTTALNRFLSEHPQICGCRKGECHFFDQLDFSSNPTHHSLETAYRLSFTAACQDEQFFIDSTPSYMYTPQAAQRIYHYNPSMKIIFVLRDPVERALSHYWMERGRGREALPFWLALFLEKARTFYLQKIERDKDPGRRLTWSYFSRGLYSIQIDRFLKWFPRQQILLLTQQQLDQHHEQTLCIVYNFLGIPQPSDLPAKQRLREGSYPRNHSQITTKILRLAYHRERVRLEKLTGMRL